MQTTISGHQIEVTEALREYINKKIGRLDNHFELTSARVTLSLEHLNHKVEALLHVSGEDISASAKKKDDMYGAIDLLADKLTRQLEKHKGKRLDRKQG